MTTPFTSVTERVECACHSFCRTDSVKALRLNECSERELLTMVHCYLSGCFLDDSSPEVREKRTGYVAGNGYVDSVIDDVTIESAARKPTAAKSTVLATVSSTDRGFSGRALPGKGIHKKSVFNVAYFYVEKRRPLTFGKITKNIRIN